MMFMMLGSKEVLPEAPKKKTMFLEDMSDAQLATAVSIMLVCSCAECAAKETGRQTLLVADLFTIA